MTGDPTNAVSPKLKRVPLHKRPTILVTGATGFIGSHTCVELLHAGYDVIGVDNFANSSPKVLDAIRLICGRSIGFIEGDVADAKTLEIAFTNRPVAAVIHFAGLKSVNESVRYPMQYYRTNIGTTMSLIEAMIFHNVHRMVFSSSCTVYGEPDAVPISELAPLKACNPYGRTKLIIEEMFRDLAASNNAWEISLLRYFNPVGAHPSGELGEDPVGVPTNLMPVVMQTAVGRYAEVSVFGGDYPTRDGTCIRDYLHVVDLAVGHILALEALDGLGSGCRAYNLGMGKGVSVLEMLAAAQRAVGKPIPYRIVNRREGDSCAVFADASLARSVLGWHPTRTVDDMCADHWGWQSKHPFGFQSVPLTEFAHR